MFSSEKLSWGLNYQIFFPTLIFKIRCWFFSRIHGNHIPWVLFYLKMVANFKLECQIYQIWNFSGLNSHYLWPYINSLWYWVYPEKTWEKSPPQIKSNFSPNSKLIPQISSFTCCKWFQPYLQPHHYFSPHATLFLPNFYCAEVCNPQFGGNS